MGLGRIFIAVALSAVVSPPAGRAADAIHCKAAILRHGTTLFSATKDITARCESEQLRGLNAASGCPTTQEFNRIGTVTVHNNAGIGLACGATIPQTTTSCVDSGASEAFALVGGVFGGFPLAEPDGTLRACRNAIGREAVRLGDVKARQLAICNENVLNGVAGYGPAGPTCDGPGGTQATIADAQTRLESKIARACGGPDHVAGTADDLDPQDALGFGPTCPGAPYCEFAIDTLPDLITCASCIAQQEVDQVSRGLAALPLDVTTACDVGVDQAITKLANDDLNDLSACEEKVLSGNVTPPCPDQQASDNLSGNATAYVTRIANACTGPAGPPASDVEDLASTLVDVLYPLHAEETDNQIQRCKSEIGNVANSVSGFARRKLNALGTCHIQSLCGQTSGPCPDSEASQRISQGATSMAQKIHSRCDPYTPSALGFGTTCAAIGGCGTLPTTTIDELIACLQCVGEGTVDEVIALGF